MRIYQFCDKSMVYVMP